MTWLQFIVAIVDAIAWPSVILVAVLVISPHLKILLPRLRSVGPQGVELFPQSSEKIPTADDLDSNLEEGNLQPLEDCVAAQIENKNKADLENIKLEDRQNALLRALTLRQLEKYFALAYADIFGSQIEILDELNARPMSREEAQRRFKTLQSTYPAFENVSLDQYAAYLLRWKLVREQNGRYEITPTGRNFLTFIAQHGLSKQRAL